MAWSGFGRRLAKLAVLLVAVLVAVPLISGSLLALAIGGWTSVVIAIVSWLGLAILLGLTLRFGSRAARPVKSLIETAGRLSDGDYSARVEPSDSVPVRAVIDSFNRMAEQLERSENDRRQLLADVGHELRTPLTIIRGELEAMADGIRRPGETEIRRLLDDIAVMERLLDDLRTLSTAEAGMLRIHREPTEIVGLVQEVAGRHEAAASAAGVSLSLNPAGERRSIDAEVDPVRVREILSNVIANAIRATPAGGTVTVDVRQSAGGSPMDPVGDPVVTGADGTFSIVVTDTGQGLSTDDADRVFDRFHKGPESKGSGLGLTISRNLALAHGGQIALESEVGVGTTVSIQLPLTCATA